MVLFVQIIIEIPQLLVDAVADVPVVRVVQVSRVPSWEETVEFAIRAGKGWRGRRESDSQVT